MKKIPSQSGIQLAYLDNTTAPSENFYQFANGGWESNFEIPADKASYGSFYQLRDQLENDVQGIYQELSQKPASELNDRESKVLALYSSYMDEDEIERQGLTPIKPWLDRCAALQSTNDWLQFAGELATLGVASPMFFWVLQDRRNANQYVPILYQSGLALPDRDYYLSDDKKLQSIKESYVTYLSELFQKIGLSSPESRAQKVVAFETAIAQAQWTKADNRDPDKTYNPMTIDDLTKISPNIAWREYLPACSAPIDRTFEVYQPSYFTEFGEVLANIDLETLQSYTQAHILHTFAPVLPRDYESRHFDFFHRQIRGIPEQQERWKRAQATVDHALGEAVGELYVAKHFSPDQKQRVETMVQKLFEAMALRIKQNIWMTEETKSKAIRKLSKMKYKIGYPRKWRDYSALEVSRSNIIQNLCQASVFEKNRQLRKLEEGVDPDEWQMLPHTVNAYYHPQMVEIVFPAAILKPPMFYHDGDDAVNYGAIGAVIGHEITHGFDDKGRKFDAEGNLTDWWQPQDAQKFDGLAANLGDFFDRFDPVDGGKINSSLTMGENIADLGGVNLAWEAYCLASTPEKRAGKVDGFTREQLFFVAYAQIWAAKQREEELRRLLKVDPHSPGKYRVLGILPNVAAFYQAFEIPEGSNMHVASDRRVCIW